MEDIGNMCWEDQAGTRVSMCVCVCVCKRMPAGLCRAFCALVQD